jgi:hypothetical protein
VGLLDQKIQDPVGRPVLYAIRRVVSDFGIKAGDHGEPGLPNHGDARRRQRMGLDRLRTGPQGDRYGPLPCHKSTHVELQDHENLCGLALGRLRDP